MTEAALKMLTLYATNDTDFGADRTIRAGPFTNMITIRRFIFGCGTPTGTSPTLLLNVDDGGTDGTGTTAIADRAAAAVTVPGFTAQAVNVNASDGYRLAAGNVLIALLDTGGTSPVFPGATLIMEYVDGQG